MIEPKGLLSYFLYSTTTSRFTKKVVPIDRETNKIYRSRFQKMIAYSR